jgi:arsenical pump membrane protein
LRAGGAGNDGEVTIALLVGAALAIAGIVARPFGISEAWWTCAGALVVVAGGALSAPEAGRAVLAGSDVYFFLVGMMLLSELARRAGLFEYVAARAVRAANGSVVALFGIVFGVGVGVTALLSNDATAVVLTPAVLAAVKRAKLDPLPFAYACAFVANAASFVLPISNPANLVLFGSRLPPLGAWFAHFAIPSLLSIGATYAAMRFVFRTSVCGGFEPQDDTPELGPRGRFAAAAVALSACAIVAVGFSGRFVGLATFACALVAYAFASVRDRGVWRALGGVEWSIVPMVAGLFTIVGAIERAGAIAPLRRAVAAIEPGVVSSLALAGVTTLASNLVNNLPVGLMAASVISDAPGSVRDTIAVAVDLGPNLSITGSLATVLWLAALRREGVDSGFVQFLKIGSVVTLPALAACAVASAFVSSAR